MVCMTCRAAASKARNPFSDGSLVVDQRPLELSGLIEYLKPKPRKICMRMTFNVITMLALTLSIGLLIDDAIVVIENIARHWAMGDGRERRSAAVDAVAEVGNPTIVATLTVVAAILPMAFVGGLMGPYMRPIPIGASAAMLLASARRSAVSALAASRWRDNVT